MVFNLRSLYETPGENILTESQALKRAKHTLLFRGSCQICISKGVIRIRIMFDFKLIVLSEIPNPKA